MYVETDEYNKIPIQKYGLDPHSSSLQHHMNPALNPTKNSLLVRINGFGTARALFPFGIAWWLIINHLFFRHKINKLSRKIKK